MRQAAVRSSALFRVRGEVLPRETQRLDATGLAVTYDDHSQTTCRLMGDCAWAKQRTTRA
ncbi:hypothetical protein SAMN05192543_101406 [Paraburkholderia megapolitana]|uniref:Uncharacterized protein n=1 Tax=Paraburkholderia megapolitana TaxID=420953 RepID=A0A1I3DMK7_9BURK|nr:hypothetical protein SAMN05192543_101406 [Paraburkholderia megapolitana]